MFLEFYPLRFTFTALDTIYFPPGKASNLLRGAFGLIFRRLACDPHCPGARQCQHATACAYARIFEPASDTGPSGLRDRPRPFVFRAHHLDGSSIRAGGTFSFEFNLFEVQFPVHDILIAAFTGLAQEGLGPVRGRAELLSVTGLELTRLTLAPSEEAVGRIEVEFVTPTELKSGDQLAATPEFGILFARLRDRIASLATFYGRGPLLIDFRGLGDRANQVRMTACDIRHEQTERRSSRTGQVHGLGGFVGRAVYEGDLGEFLPYLGAGRWCGVGRHAVWGNGELAVRLLPTLDAAR